MTRCNSLNDYSSDLMSINETSTVADKVHLEDVLITDALSERPSRVPDYRAENQAFQSLARQLATEPNAAPRKWAEIALELCHAGSAGISLLEPSADGREVFRWVAIAGEYQALEGGTAARDFSVCGTCLDRQRPQLFLHPCRYFGQTPIAHPQVVEALAIPFGCQRPVLGTVWVVAHDEQRHFDAEDVRIMTNLADFAAAALQQVFIGEQNERLLRQAQAELDERKRTEERLADARRRLNAALAAGAIATWVWDVVADRVYPDENLARLVSLSPEDAAGGPVEHYLRAVHPDDLEAVRRAMDRSLAAGDTFESENRLTQPDGTFKWVVSRGRIERDATGRAIRTSGVVVDITKRKAAEESLRRSEMRFRGLMEQAPVSMMMLSPDGWTRQVNRAWEKLWGTRLEDLSDYNMLEDRQLEEEGVLPYLRRAFAGEAVAIPEIRYDPRRTLPNHEFPDEPVRWVSTVAYPVKDDAGRVREVVMIHQDITDQRKAEAALRESEENLRLLADTIPQLAWMAGPEGQVLWYNRRWYEYTGRVAGERDGWDWKEVHDPQSLPAVLERWERSVATGEPFDMVVRLRGADGEYRPFLTRVNPLRDEEGRIRYWFGTNTDISDLMQMEEALRDAHRRKDEFLATLAHELRNPLAPIRSAMQLIRVRRHDETTVNDALAIVERQVQQMVRLVNDLLDVSRITRNKLELHREEIELAEVVQTAVETARPSIEASGHQLTIELPPEPIHLRGDPVRLAQVFSNLLNNAAKYTERGGRIWLTAECLDHYCTVHVRDTGIGIASEMLPHVFDSFTQGQRALERSQGGLGIGLALVKRLVEMHGGIVEARSEGPGKGSEFIVRLPTYEPQGNESQPPEQEVNERDRAAATGCRVLVVDDNRDAATTLAAILRITGNDVRTAHDGVEALQVAEPFRPDCILLDIGLPGMNGYEVARRLREAPWGKGVVLVALTGWGQEGDRQRSRDAGFDHHLVKPIDYSALEQLLAEHHLAQA
jgi:PAS domain S-box-containing protein